MSKGRIHMKRLYLTVFILKRSFSVEHLTLTLTGTHTVSLGSNWLPSKQISGENVDI
jgi:hypothetical protein